MKKSRLIKITLGATLTLTFAGLAGASEKVAFYLHGKGIDDGKSTEGYESNVAYLESKGFKVISEPRKPGQIRKPPKDHEKYSKTLAEKIEGLISQGTDPSDITVVGYSRGATLAMLTSGYVANENVNYALLAGCVDASGPYGRAAKWQQQFAKKLKGNFLSIYESSDKAFASCQNLFSLGGVTQTEVKLNTGEGHKLFYKPESSWTSVMDDWTK